MIFQPMVRNGRLTGCTVAGQFGARNSKTRAIPAVVSVPRARLSFLDVDPPINPRMRCFYQASRIEKFRVA
jgi:hypothetical protein